MKTSNNMLNNRNYHNYNYISSSTCGLFISRPADQIQSPKYLVDHTLSEKQIFL